MIPKLADWRHRESNKIECKNDNYKIRIMTTDQNTAVRTVIEITFKYYDAVDIMTFKKEEEEKNVRSIVTFWRRRGRSHGNPRDCFSTVFFVRAFISAAARITSKPVWTVLTIRFFFFLLWNKKPVRTRYNDTRFVSGGEWWKIIIFCRCYCYLADGFGRAKRVVVLERSRPIMCVYSDITWTVVERRRTRGRAARGQGRCSGGRTSRIYWVYIDITVENKRIHTRQEHSKKNSEL